MSYYYTKITDYGFDEAIEKVTEELQKEGFGVLTEIDVTATFKKKINVDFRPYRILGACNPHFAHQAIQDEEKIGNILPCNVIVQQLDNGKVKVSAVNPMASMMAVKNDALEDIATQVSNKLENVIKQL